MGTSSKLAASIRQQLEEQGGTLTVYASSPEHYVLAQMCQAGDVEQVATQAGRITYRLIPLPHPFRRRDVVMWTGPNGVECRARVVSVSRKSVRIMTLADGMVRNVDPASLRYAYAPQADTSFQDLLGPEYQSVFGRALVAWLESKPERSCSVRAKRSYVEILSSFRAALHAAKLDIDSVPQKVAGVAREWASQYHARSNDPLVSGVVSPATFNQRLATVSSFYKFALQHGLLSGTNPIDMVARQAVPTGRARSVGD